MKTKVNKNTSKSSGNRAQRRIEPRARRLVDTPGARNRTVEQNYADGYRSQISLNSFFLTAFEASPVILCMYLQMRLDKIRAKLDRFRKLSEAMSTLIDVLLKQRERLALAARVSTRLKGTFIKLSRSIPLNRDAIPIAVA